MADSFRSVVVEGGVRLALVGAPLGSGLKASRVSTLDVGEEEGSMPVGGCTCSPGPLPLEVMSNELAIDDGHPLALELQSLRTTVAKYQVSVIVLFASQPISSRLGVCFKARGSIRVREASKALTRDVVCSREVPSFGKRERSSHRRARCPSSPPKYQPRSFCVPESPTEQHFPPTVR